MNENNNLENDEIVLGDLFRAIIKHLWLAVIITISITILGGVYTFGFAKEKYRATSSVVVAVTVDEKGDKLDYNSSLKLINTIQDLIYQDVVIEDVCKKHDVKKDALVQSIKVSSNKDSFIMNVSVVDTDKDKTIVLVNSIVDELVLEVNNNDVFEFAKNKVKVTSYAKESKYDSPNKPLYLLISMVLGGVISLVVIFVLEFASSKFKNTKEVEQELKVNVIGKFYEDKKINRNNNNNNNKVVTLLEPTIRNFEPYNKLLANIKYSNLENPYKVIMLSSSIPNELKSTMAANLAFDIVNNNKKVCLIDLDTRKPLLHKTFKVSKDNGLVEYIEGSIERNDLIKHSDIGVDIITCGKHIINPMVIVESKKLKELIKELRKEYDYVLIDTPPLSMCTDGLVISKLVDGVIMNVAMDFTKKKVAVENLNSLRNVNANIIGINATRIKTSKKESSYYYYYGEE